MKVGLLSDTHDQLARTTRAVSLLQAHGAELLIHCGDLTGPRIVHACSALPCHYVLGNNDFDESILRAAVSETGGSWHGLGGVVELAGKRLAVTHGHLSSELRRLLKTRPDYIVFGHSHVSEDTRDGPLRQINPGALHRARVFSVAILDICTEELDFLTVP